MPEFKENINEKNSSSVLITGASGLIGKHLTSLLLEKGYRVSHLSRKIKKGGKVRSFLWDPEKGSIDPEAFAGIDFIIHLAGANIGEKRWTRKRKQEILDSRTKAARLLFKTVKEKGITLKAFISASGVSIYGTQTSEKIYKETDPAADDFLGNICRQWEEAADLFEYAGIRTVKLRTAVVIDKNDSALSKLMMPAKFGFLAQTGDGLQFMPWIHIDDICNIYLKAVEDPAMTGAYNAAAPQYTTHKEFIKVLSRVMRKPVFPVPVAGFILKMIFGEMSGVILEGSRVSDEKLLSSGFHFSFEKLEDALKDVLSIRASK